MFEKVLRAFETRGITYSDVLARLRRLLATGALPTELLPILRRRESAERMPEYARLEALLLEAIEQSAAADEHPESTRSGDPVATDAAATELHRPDDEVSVDLEFDAPANALSSPRGLRAAELDLSVLAQHLRSVEERVPPRAAALEALTRSFEKAREGEWRPRSGPRRLQRTWQPPGLRFRRSKASFGKPSRRWRKALRRARRRANIAARIAAIPNGTAHLARIDGRARCHTRSGPARVG